MKKANWIPRSMFYRVMWPSMISGLALAAADIADALVVGSQLGEKGLAAIGLVTPVYMLYNLFGYGFATGGCVNHGKLAAQGREKTALCHFSMLAARLLLGAAAAALLANLLMDQLLFLLGADGRRPELLALCTEYARPLLSAAPLFMLNYLLYDFVRVDNDPALASLGLSTGCAADLILNIVLVIGMGMGVRGAVLATVASQGISAVILSLHLFQKRGILQWKALRASWSERKGVRKQVLSSLTIGFSSSFRYIFQFLFLLGANHLLLRAGDRGLINGDLYVAVFDVVMNVSYVLLAPYQSASEAVQPLGAAFTQEHDRRSLRYVLRLTMAWGLGIGAVMAGLTAVFSGQVSAVFGLQEAAAKAVSVPAIRIFCLSTPLAGILIILTGFSQSTGQELASSLITGLRSFVFLQLSMLLFGFLWPAGFWWVFPVSEAAALGTVLLIRRRLTRKWESKEAATFSACMDNADHELGKVLAALEEYCEAREIPLRKAAQLQLAVEELCLVTMEQAFSGKPDEYIQVTMAEEDGGDYSLCIRNSAPRFNPFQMETGRLQRDQEEQLMDSMGVLLVKKQAKSMHYRNYEGFNVLRVVL